jgi:hypothetical protein
LDIEHCRRHKIRGRVTQPFDLGSTGHTFKAGGGYEFGTEHAHITPVSQNTA